MTTLAESWRSYFDMVYPDGVFDPEQAEQVRMAFYGGAAAYQELLAANSHDRQIIVKLNTELRDYLDNWKMRHGK